MSHTLLEDLRVAYQSGNLVIFAGAGVSAAAGLPTWKRLAENLVGQLRVRAADEADITEIEELIRKDQYIDALSAAKLALGAQEFGLAVEKMLDNRGKEVPDVARAIARLAPTLRTVVTTNLDSFLEEAFGGKWHPFIEPPGDLVQQKHYILKLHGTLRDRSSWVFSREQYDRAMFRSPRLQATFGALYQAYPILFVGCGLADDNIDLTLAQVRALADEQPPAHFALLPQPIGQLLRIPLHMGTRSAGTWAPVPEHVGTLGAKRRSPGRGLGSWCSGARSERSDDSIDGGRHLLEHRPDQACFTPIGAKR